ncbi:hypothetical protein HRR83_007389 [Exophiala dermatitidis]|uniref:Uncharacterized protein n=2 Tax=Exophiala dermatitidis TaxID=5970 RepID=H6C1Y0_EXODN|nr:uncharacterized protein HMPREF1120_06671 [Exophiala dermatitidis NIH/UT8656]KAJ4508452.1 hypothetical protein HRR75_006273 [Exophiala dermatitidis]EHY58667.1 hypothetical protein HMPREF1120_06671 [Exophiala dermatitidis NIH/UT8656]KAJ4510363.1 hypothetical protein HRR74_006835 [Exophiala dermatitidis]KAJ4510702.1 hypothetical protein HRR73_006774 [Exophiala dermatitidis]KAJ4534971.1 hypothetical protein HRR76_006873 [Exophiala dermatitidis]
MANSDSSSPMPVLPAFGIRSLNGPHTSPAVVQITAGQYDQAVKSWPEVALIYLDDDDGEIVTVGSGLELEQRLDEPAKNSTFRVPEALLPARATADDGDSMMHIFDIRRGHKSVAVWKKHEAETTKKMKRRDLGVHSGGEHVSSLPGAAEPKSASASEHGASKSDLSDTSSVKQIDGSAVVDTSSAPSEQSAQSQQGSNVTPEPAKSFPSVEEASSSELDNILFDVFSSLGSNLGPVADFLEATAQGLRKVAEKKAGGEASPVEDVLTGFKGILSSVGELGLQFLSAVDRELQEQKTGTATQTDPSPSQPVQSESSAFCLPPLIMKQPETNAKKVTFVGTPWSEAEKLEDDSDLFYYADQNGWKCFNHKDYARSATNKYSPADVLQHNPPPRPATQAVQNKASVSPPPRSSILDQDPSEPDFSARYPPLLSVRKAKSVAGLNKPTHPPPVGHVVTNTATTLTRYPTIGQFEQQTRINMTKHASTPHLREWPPRSYLSCRSTDTAPKPKKTDVYKAPSVEDDVGSGDTTVDGPQVQTGVKEKSTGLRSKWVPGAWPEQKTEDLHPSPAASNPSYPKLPDNSPEKSATSTQGEGSGGLFQRGSSGAGYHSVPSLHLPRRYHTVSGTNPAARLNGPFDPLASLTSHDEDGTSRDRPTSRGRNWATSRGMSSAESQLAGHLQSDMSSKKQADYLPPSMAWAPLMTARYRHVAAPYPHLHHMRPRPAPVSRPARPKMMSPMTSVQSFGSASAVAGPAHPLQSEATAHGGASDKKLSLDSSGPSFPHLAPSHAHPKAGLIPIITPAPYTRPTGRHDASAVPPPTSTLAADQCTKTLKAMGYGLGDDNEMSRLNMYASATAGDVEAAIEMIEEDREAAKELTELLDAPKGVREV